MAGTRDWRQWRDEQAARLEKATGETLGTWAARVRSAGLPDRPAITAWLAERGVTGYAAMLLRYEQLGYPDFMTATADSLVDAQYADRPALRPIYDAVLEAALGQGEVTVQTRKTYVSLLTPRRTFIRVQATTLKRVDVALRLAADAGGRLVRSRHENMPVQFGLASVAELDDEAVELMRRTYEANV
ncbi:MAG: hypothetical protein JNL41_19560 [Phenylobacterium sp.]|uniref:DUF5655 domain-containing protein n=1 Tax=Phenylobacterium sp. TaxID=1871053 RepID=UPI001A52AF94|nr:DUF5655 domain-containing protein [Phenylobacterium sp.]MBL8556480.1 hypothetical protein [Phenylobacterium sp.]